MDVVKAAQDYQATINSINEKYNSMMSTIQEWQKELDNLQSEQPAKSKQWVEGKKQALTEKIANGMQAAQEWLDQKMQAAQEWLDQTKQDAQDWLLKQAQKKIESLI